MIDLLMSIVIILILKKIKKQFMAINLQRTAFTLTDNQKNLAVNLTHKAGKTSINTTPGSNAFFNLIRKICNTIRNTFRSVDGIDEATLPVGLLLSPTGQAILSLTVVGVGTPFVALGAEGAVIEMRERFHERIPQMLEKMLRHCTEIEKLLERHGIATESDDISMTFDDCESGLQLIQLSSKVTRKCQAFLQLLETHRDRFEKDVQLVHMVEQFGQDMNILAAELIDRNMSPLGAYAMMSMTVGMVMLCAQSITKLIELHSATVSAAIAAGKIVPISGCISATGMPVFLLAQIVMAIYGAGCATAGIRHDNNMKKDSEVLHEFQQLYDSGVFPELALLPQAVTMSQELLKEKRHCNRWHSTLYGSGTAVGQSFMASYTLITLLISAGVVTAAAAPAIAAVLAAAGVPLTVGMAASRIIYKNKESRLLGADASDAARTKATAFVQHKIIRAAAEIDPQRALQNAMQATTEELDKQQKLVAESKLHSIIDKALIKARKNHTAVTAENLRAEVSNEINRLIAHKESRFRIQHTTLLAGDLKLMKTLFEQDYGMNFFANDMEKTQENLNERVMKNLADSQLTLSDNSIEKALHYTAKKLIKINGEPEINAALQTDHFTVAAMQQLSETNISANSIMNRKLTSLAIKQLKDDGKYLRNMTSGHLIPLMRVFNQIVEIKRGYIPVNSAHTLNLQTQQ